MTGLLTLAIFAGFMLGVASTRWLSLYGGGPTILRLDDPDVIENARGYRNAHPEFEAK